MNVIQTYLQKSQQIFHTVAQQKDKFCLAAQWFTETILAGRMVHVFGSGHSRIMVEEMGAAAFAMGRNNSAH